MKIDVKYLKTLESAIKKQPELPPNDKYMSFWEIFELLNTKTKIGENLLRKIIRNGLKSGEIKVFIGTSEDAIGRNSKRIWYYWPKLFK